MTTNGEQMNGQASGIRVEPTRTGILLAVSDPSGKVVFAITLSPEQASSLALAIFAAGKASEVMLANGQ